MRPATNPALKASRKVPPSALRSMPTPRQCSLNTQVFFQFTQPNRSEGESKKNKDKSKKKSKKDTVERHIQGDVLIASLRSVSAKDKKAKKASIAIDYSRAGARNTCVADIGFS